MSHGLNVYTGTRYLGGFIGDDMSKRDCLQDCTTDWENTIVKTKKTAGKHPQESYSTVVYAIQLEWIFLLYVKKKTGYAFKGEEKLPRKTFLPHLFF